MPSSTATKTRSQTPHTNTTDTDTRSKNAPTPRPGSRHGRPTEPRTPVADLVPGTPVNELYVVSEKHLRQGGKTGTYLTFRLRDASGAVPAVYWPADVGEAEEVFEELDEGAVARIKGDVVSYRERTEVRIAAPNGGVSPVQHSRIDPEPFVPTSSVSERELRDAIEVRIGLISDPHLRRLLRSLFADKERADAYFRLPARLTGPHAHLRGLAEEAVETARIAGAAAGSIPGLDRDLVTAAALFAPAGAILAYAEAGLAHEETTTGLLLPAHVLAADLAVGAAREAASIPTEQLQRLRHVLVREPEVPRYGWSSGPDAVLPETVVLHHALRMSRMVPEAKAAFDRRTGTPEDA